MNTEKKWKNTEISFFISRYFYLKKKRCSLNITAARRIDKYAGRPVCFALTLFRRLVDVLIPRGSYRCPNKILFIKLAEQGCGVLAYPAVKDAEKTVGRENIYYLVFAKNRPILDLMEIVTHGNIIEIDSSGFWKFAITSLKALFKIRREKIDAAVDLEFFSRASAILSYLCGARIRVGLHLFFSEGPYRGDLFTHRIGYNPYAHSSVLYRAMVRALRQSPPNEITPVILKTPEDPASLSRFAPKEDERRALADKIRKLKGSDVSVPVVVLNPKITDRLPVRRWPEERYADLAGLILRDFPNAGIFITGDKREAESAGCLAQKCPGAVSLAGELTLRELLVLYSGADCLVTSDSGPAHFASLTPVKSVVLFGPETPLLFAPLGENSVIIGTDLICSPCVGVYNQRNSPCPSAKCLKEISVQTVYEKVRQILAK
jgi:ADP-heptose:LPS heptosyltransferase